MKLVYSLKSSVQFNTTSVSLIQLSSKRYFSARENPYAFLHPVSQDVSQMLRFETVPMLGLIDL